MQFRRQYPVPIDLRRELHAVTVKLWLFGYVTLSLRQLLYIVGAGAIVVGAVVLLPAPAKWIVGAFLAAILIPVVVLLGWARAGAWGLPGPKNRDRFHTVQEEPLRLDEWLFILFSWRAAPKVVRYRFCRQHAGGTP